MTTTRRLERERADAIVSWNIHQLDSAWDMLTDDGR